MKWFKVADGRSEPTELGRLSFGQVQQTAALADCLGRLIPQEGVDYDVHIILKEPTEDEKAQHKTPTRVSMQIVALTEKGEWWKRYVGKMIRKYPPTTTYKGDMLPDNPKEAEDAKVVS